MIGFHEVRFPEDVSYGSSGGPEFKTQVFETFRGFEKRNIDWCQPMMNFNVAYGIKQDTQMMSVLDFFNARQGRAYGFRYKNWVNYQVTAAPIAAGDGASVRLPLYKFYGFQSARQYKRLRKIVRGSVSGVGIAAPGTLVEGVDYNIDYENGEIALNSAPGYGVPVYGTLEFDEPVRFDVDNIQIVIDQYNNNSLSSLPLIGVKSNAGGGSVFSPTEIGGGEDPFFESARLILNFDDIATPTTTVDDSSLAQPVTINGDGTLVSADFVHGEGSFQPNTTGYCSVSGAAFSVTNLPFTIECFIRRPASGEDQQTIIGKWAESGTNRCWTLRYQHPTQQLQFVVSSDGIAETVVLNYPWTIGSFDRFDYVSVDRLPSGWYVLRINGIVQQKYKNTIIVNDAATDLVVGSLAAPGVGQGPFRELIDSVRVTIGRNRHPAFENVTVPTPYAT